MYKLMTLKLPQKLTPKLEKRHQANFQWRFFSPRFWPTWSSYVLCFFLRLIPMKVLGWIGDGIAGLMARGNTRRKRLAMTNLTLCFPHESAAERERLYLRHARILSHTYLNYGRLFFANRKDLTKRFDIEGRETLQRFEEAGKNIILLIPHCLAFEYAGQWLAIHYPLVSVVRTHIGNDVLDWMVTRFRTRFGAEFVSNSGSMLPLIRSVRRGNWLFYLPDEDQGQATSVFAPFYGVAKATMPTLGRLLKACNAEVVPVVPQYDPDTRRFKIRFLPALQGISDAEPALAARRINEVVEAIVNTDRAQYMWSAKIFRTRPAGEAKLY